MPAISYKNNVLVYKGHSFFKERLILSIISGKSVKIVNMSTKDDNPGIKEYEVNLLRLLSKVTNGTNFELNSTGTSVFFQPGLLHGGTIEHDCSTDRSIGYYLEVLVMLGFFCKHPINATLRGVTNNAIDPSVDHIKASTLPVMKRFIIDHDGLDIVIKKRGMPPNGGGEIIFKCPIVTKVRPVQLSDFGMVKRIRGTAYALRVSPAMANRLVDSAKGVLLNFIPDIFISTDRRKGEQSGKSPGFGIHLYAETTTGVIYSAEAVSNVVTEGVDPSLPEDLGLRAAKRLCHEISLGGCADSATQSLAILFMSLRNDVSKLLTGPLTDHSVNFMQHLWEFVGVRFKLAHQKDEEDEETNKVLLTCCGIEYSNISKNTL